MLIKAKIKLGFDRARAKDIQWLFTNYKIQPSSIRQHVVDSFLEFPKRLGLEPVMKWDLPISEHDVETIKHMVSGDNYLVINPARFPSLK